jgi:uncharacterized LabA/DUF88 family protein
VRKYAILVDGGFIKRKIGSREAPMTADLLNDFIERLRAQPPLDAMLLHRIYYYDAAPLETTVRKPLSGGTINFGAQPTAINNKALYRELAAKPYFALRMGELACRGWAVNGRRLSKNAESIEIRHTDLKPEIQQKGVDMRVGMDIASLTLKRLVDVIVLVTGDSDFVPAMKFARKEGAQLFLVPLGHSVREVMVEHSDIVIEVPSR